MTRTLAEKSTQVNLRMPNRILEKIDALAAENFHDRSSEINSACEVWVEAGGKNYRDATTLAKIENLETKIDELENSLDAALKELDAGKEVYMKIIETHEHTIKCLLNTLPAGEEKK